jgi:hypothetical protein
METIELVLTGLLGLAVVALIVLLRRRSPSQDTGGVLEAQVARVVDAVNRQGVDDRELRHDVGRLRELVESLRAAGEARLRAEEPVWGAVRRLEAVLAGGSARGQAGENVLLEALSLLPPGMLVRDLAVNGRRVEFALTLPDGRRMPVDSKWTAVRELEALEDEEDPERRKALCRRIEDEVARRAREVEGYLEPSLTTPFAVACVPDAAFAVCRKAHADAFARSVVLAPYSSALPLLLALYALAARYGDAGDVRACLVELEGLLGAMEATLENKLARATTMLQNAGDEWRTQLGKARGALARGRGAAEDEQPELAAVPSAFDDFDSFASGRVISAP